MSKDIEKLIAGNPASPDAGLFGMSLAPEESFISIIPVQWDATASYGIGTHKAPDAIVRASHQLDLEDLDFGKPYLHGITMLPNDVEIGILNQLTRKDVTMVREYPNRDIDDLREQIDTNGDVVNQKVYERAKEVLGRGAFCAVLGGDHSSPFGLVKALAEKYENFGVLHFDAHFDLRKGYEGFQWSHASIMANCLSEFSQISRMVHLGIRDFSHEERQFQESLGNRSAVYYSSELFRRRAIGEPFAKTALEIIGQLPDHVYVSFDIDGLDPALCPRTGTPVPGGFQFEEAVYILVQLAKSGKKIIGFDLCEVGVGDDGSEWDANVGARILYKLCGAAITSHGLTKKGH